MTCHRCGSDAATCGCCEGTQTLTPAPRENPPGLPALSYRVGTHGQFLSSMKARLSTMTVLAPGADAQTLERFRPLQGLTTREPSDPAIALLDAWATVGDVLSFYQERVANEGYLRTATERRSTLELARLVGYTPRPGVAASVYLAYTLEDRQADPVTIPAGTRAQSIPGPGEAPQAFEISEPLYARREWNNLQVRSRRPQQISAGNALAIAQLHVRGTDLQLQPGELLMLRFRDEQGAFEAYRKLERTELDLPAQRTLILLQPVDALLAAATQLLYASLRQVWQLTPLDPAAGDVYRQGRILLAEALAGQRDDIGSWALDFDISTSEPPGASLQAVLDALEQALEALLENGVGSEPGAVGDPDRFVEALLLDPIPQARNASRLPRRIEQSFQPRSDAAPQLLVNFEPKLKDSYYSAWRGSQTQSAQPELEAVHSFGASGLLFGANAAQEPVRKGEVLEFQEWDYIADEQDANAFLDKGYPQIAPGSLVLLQTSRKQGVERRLLQVRSATVGPRTAYGISGQSTRLEFDAAWRDVDAGGESGTPIDDLRSSQFFAQGRRLELAEEPITQEVSGSAVELADLHEQLQSGRWVIFSGERADIEGVAGVRASELLMVSNLVHGYDPQLPGDRTHTSLQLATPTAYRYKRDTLTIYANVVKATHGETRSETLGSGNGAQPWQQFDLRQPPLTFVAAPNASGVASTLQLYVNDVQWRETDSLAGLGPQDRAFVTRTDDAGKTTLVFGDGEQGARLPTGVENVKALYRNGIGQGGNVRAEQISLLVSRPLGVKSVLNPLRASGGADRETRDLIRENAPVSVLALDRLVSVSDYADFARSFAGIAKAAAARLSDGGRELLHLTVAGIEDMPLDPTSDLWRNLLEALRTLGDPGLALQLAARERIALLLSARVKLLDGHRWERVAAVLRETLLERFGFARRALGQPALLCEVVAAMQGVRGVAYVDVDLFGGIPEKRVGDDGRVRLLTQDEITGLVQALREEDLPDYAPGALAGEQRAPLQRVPALPARLEAGLLRPAQLAVFTPDVPDTLILNPIE